MINWVIGKNCAAGHSAKPCWACKGEFTFSREAEPMEKSFYEQQAFECRKLASEMQDLTHKKRMENMAEVWAALAGGQSQSLGFWD
jgi:hypothetical protein